MGSSNILGIGIFLLLVSTSFGVAAEEDIVPESGVIFTEPSVDLEAPTTTMTPTLKPELINMSKPAAAGMVVTPASVTETSSSTPISTDKHPIPVSTPKPTKSRVPASFRKYIDEIRNSAAEIRWIKWDDMNENQIKPHHQQHPVSSVKGVDAPPPPQEKVAVTSPPPPPLPPSTPIPTLPVPPINTISAIIRDLEKQKRDFEAIKDVHPKLHLIPRKQYLSAKPRLNLEKPLPAPETALPKQIKSAETVPSPIKGQGSNSTPDNLGSGPVSWVGNSSRWAWSLLGFGGDEGDKGVGVSTGPAYPYPHPPLPPPVQKPVDGTDKQPPQKRPAGEHPAPGQGFKYDCPFPHPPPPVAKPLEKRSWFFF